VAEEFRQCRRSSQCRASLPISQLSNIDGRWVCEIGKCPRTRSNQGIEDGVYKVEKRYLNIAQIMFLSSSASGQEPDDFAEDVAARLEEITEEIVNFNLEVYPLEGGYIGHSIEGTELVPKRKSKHEFRKRIFEHWDRKCAYCGEHADTLDHLVPRHKGGLTVPENLASCCRRCNGSKGAEDIWEWYEAQPFFNQDRADKIQEWMDQIN
jgi:hypothetical protein